MKADTKILGIIPVIGFGTWEITGEQCADSVQNALELGYRHIDTAQLYTNEREVGKGIKRSSVKRESIFVTTKIATHNFTPELIRQSTMESIQKLDTGYIDLLLIHWPTYEMDLETCLNAMFGLKDEGKIKNVGVSNFNPELFRKAISLGPVINNQVKFTPYHNQFGNLEVAHKENKILTAYSPLERGDIIKDKSLSQIGNKYSKTASQVSLRWLIQLGNVSVIPKATNEEHQKENINIFDFELSEEDMETIKHLSKNLV